MRLLLLVHVWNTETFAWLNVPHSCRWLWLSLTAVMRVLVSQLFATQQRRVFFWTVAEWKCFGVTVFLKFGHRRVCVCECDLSCRALHTEFWINEYKPACTEWHKYATQQPQAWHTFNSLHFPSRTVRTKSHNAVQSVRRWRCVLCVVLFYICCQCCEYECLCVRRRPSLMSDDASITPRLCVVLI